MGSYHGKFGFDTFSHHRAVHTRITKLDPSLMYPPYTARKQKLVRKGMVLPDPRDLAAKLRGAFRRS
jgi:aldehyde dehydrogenase (NAD+)